MTELWRILRDPRVSTTIVLAAIAVAGFALVALGWRGAAATVFVPFQVPYVVSGGLLGLGLLGAGLGLLKVHVDRVEAAEERRQTAELQRQVLRTLSAVVRR